MKKIETIWHHIITRALERGQFKHTQQAISGYFGYSLSTTNLAVGRLAAIGAVEKRGKFFVVTDAKKALLYWATHRTIAKSVLFETYVDLPVTEIEGRVPPGVIPAGYTAAKHILSEPPADYSRVYVYSDEACIDEAKQRFPKTSGALNFFALKSFPKQKEYGAVTTIAQTFVDIWNMHDWYAKDFLDALERRIDELLS